MSVLKWLGAAALVALLLDDEETQEGHGGLVWPLDECTALSSAWGVRPNPFADDDDVVECHGGIDIPCRKGARVRVVDDGVVIRSDFKGKLEGGFVAVKHPDGYASYYMHLSALYPRVGDNVVAGEFIGEVGSTGRSTGNHLHLQFMSPEGDNIDPGPFYGLQPGTRCPH